MRKFLFAFLVSFLIMSCSSNSNQSLQADSKPKYDSTVIGQWKDVREGKVVEITPTLFKTSYESSPYFIKGDTFYLVQVYDNIYDTVRYKLFYNSTHLQLEHPDNIKGDMAFERYDPEQEKKELEQRLEARKKSAEEWAEERKRNKGNEQNGAYIDYCPVCMEDADDAYGVQNGQIVKTGSLVKGGPLMCYSCAKQVQARGY